MPKPRNSAAPLFRLPELYRLLAVLMIGLALVLGTAAKTLIEIGTTVKVVNQVRAKILNRRLKLGDNVVYQETVSTGKASAVDILLIDESTLIMGEISELILVDDLDRGADLDQRLGRRSQDKGQADHQDRPMRA